MSTGPLQTVVDIIEFPIEELISHWTTVKDVAEAAIVILTITNPPASALLTAAIALVEALMITGPTSIKTNAVTILQTSTAILSAVTPIIKK